MTKSYQMVILAMLLRIVLLFPLRPLMDVLDKNAFPSPFLYQIRPYTMESALRARNWGFEVGVERTVAYASFTYSSTNKMVSMFAQMIVALLLTAFGSVRKPKTAGRDRSVELPQKLEIHSGSVLNCTNSARTGPSNTKSSEPIRGCKALEPTTLQDIIGSDGTNKPGFTIHSTKYTENMAILPHDIYVFQVLQLQLVTETTLSSGPTSSLASSRYTTEEDFGNQVGRQLTISQAQGSLEISHPTSLEDPQRTIAARNSLPLHNQPRQQPMVTEPTVLEEHPAQAVRPPLHPHRTYTPVVYEVDELNDDMSTVQPLESIEVQVPTRTIDQDRGGLVRSDIGNVSRNNIIAETWSTNDGYTGHTSTVAHAGLPYSSPELSLGPSPVPNARNQSYRPIFQPLTPAVERSIEAEQPWSPELQRPVGLAREAIFRDDFDKLDALGL